MVAAFPEVVSFRSGKKFVLPRPPSSPSLPLLIILPLHHSTRAVTYTPLKTESEMGIKGLTKLIADEAPDAIKEHKVSKSASYFPPASCSPHFSSFHPSHLSLLPRSSTTTGASLLSMPLWPSINFWCGRREGRREERKARTKTMKGEERELGCNELRSVHLPFFTSISSPSFIPAFLLHLS